MGRKMWVKNQDNRISKDTLVLGVGSVVCKRGHWPRDRCFSGEQLPFMNWLTTMTLAPTPQNVFIYSFPEVTVIWCKVPIFLVNILLSVLTVVGSVAMVVTLPLYSSAVICAGSDPYSVLFFSSFWFQMVKEYLLQQNFLIFLHGVCVQKITNKL